MIRLNGVTKKYDDLVAVDGLSLEVARGEIFGFIGPNGAGKTTTIKMLAGLLRPSAGRIEIDGKDIASLPEETKRILGYIPDTPYLYETLSAREFLIFVGKIYGLSTKDLEARMQTLFAYFGMDGWAHLRAEEYSHGMRQKVVISSALLHEPRVLVVDEPMVGLDPQSAKKVKELFRARSREGTTVFLSTHTLSVAEELCARIGVIHKGKLIACGTVEELRKGSGSRSRTLEELYLELTEYPDSPPSR